MGNNSYERYAKIRDLRGFTDYQVTKRAGIKGTATISNWKNGKYTPKDDKMQEIANVLEVDLNYLKGKKSYTVCPVCGFDDDPLNENINKQHKIFHEQYLKIKEKYPFFMPFSEASIEKTDRIFEFRNPQKTLEGKIDAFEKYLEAAFSLEICQNNYNIDHLDYEQFCKVEVGTLEPDYAISNEFIDALIEKYGVDKSYLSGNEQLLARVSNNSQLMRILKYAEMLNPKLLDALEIQTKALAEQSDKE